MTVFSDLDGTLIFSAKKMREGDFVIEYKDGEPISCITARQAEIFPALSNVIPVTTRSIEQYKRIDFAGFGFNPLYALCDNGGTLLINGSPDSEWLLWSGAIYAECEREMNSFRDKLERDENCSFEIRLVDGLFLFTKSSRPGETLKMLGESELCECFAVGGKIYVVPKGLNKGAAVKRLAARLEIPKYICAGDSLMDASMLNTADYALFSDNIPEELITTPERIIHPHGGFPEYVAEYAYLKRSAYV